MTIAPPPPMDLSNISLSSSMFSKSTDALESDPVPHVKQHAPEQLVHHEKNKRLQEAGLIPSFLKSETYVKATSIGVYEVLEEVQSWGAAVPGWGTWEGARTFVEDWPFILRFFKECLALAPEMIVTWFFCNILMSLMPAISLYFSSQLMGVIQHCIEHGVKELSAFYRAAGSVLLWSFVQNRVSRYYEQKVKSPMKRRLEASFNEYTLRISIRLDVPTFHDPIVKAKLAQIAQNHTDGQAWKIFSGVVDVVSSAIGIASELYMLSSLLQGEECGRFFVALAAVRPLFYILNLNGEWPQVFYVYAANKVYNRMTTLSRLTSGDDYRKHIIADGLQQYIEEGKHKQYKNSWRLLKNTRTDDIWDIMEQNESTFRMFMNFFAEASSEMPLILFAFQAIRNSKSLPLKSINLLSNSANSIGWRVGELFQELKRLGGFNKTLRTFYEAIEIVNQIEDGDIPYPHPTSTDLGMKIEFKSVSFTYPKKDTPALQNLSFTIQPGQLCVIVGENGCGKSSTVNLLGRLFDATKGEILVDDIPIRKFKAEDLRLAQAILYQDFVKYPTSIRDNIGFGHVDELADTERIRNAAAAGGALEFIEKLPGGFDTPIEAAYAVCSSLSRAKENGPLQTRVKSLEDTLSISGGQWQRLAISRSFMRALDNDQVRLMCYDEPSSALDPKAEFELFEKLRKGRGKKTLIFITHRFGHLTKHADLILYIKNGKVIEQGTHAELLEKGGHYTDLYNVQAQAFN